MALITDQPENLETTNALDNLPIQGALIEEAVVQFSGNSRDLIENPPSLDDERIYTVKATCIEVKNKRRDDGEVRTTVVMHIDSCHEQGRVPTIGGAGSLFAPDTTSDDGEAGE